MKYVQKLIDAGLLVLTVVILAAAIAAAFPRQAHSAELGGCFVGDYDSTRSTLNNQVTDLTGPALVAALKLYLPDVDPTKATRGFIDVAPNGKKLLGVEVGGCLRDPIDITGANI